MLQINHLSVTHIRDLRPIVTDFSLVLQPGEKAAVITGTSGRPRSFPYPVWFPRFTPPCLNFSRRTERCWTWNRAASASKALKFVPV